MKQEFLPRDPTKSLIEIKEKLYDRLMVLRSCLNGSYKDEHGYVDPFDIQMNNELQFLEELLDLIERS